jgi:hypothetical protein
MKRIAVIATVILSAMQLAAQEPGEKLTTRNFYFSDNTGHVFHHEDRTVRTAGVVTGSVLHDSYIGASGIERLSEFDADAYAAKHELEWMLAKVRRKICPEWGEEQRIIDIYYAAQAGKAFHHPGWNEKMLGVYLQYRQGKLYHELRGQYFLRSLRVDPRMVEADVPLWSLSPLQYYYLPKSFDHSALYQRMNAATYGTLHVFNPKVDQRLLRDVTGKHRSVN